jgi:hypothetical protein
MRYEKTILALAALGTVTLVVAGGAAYGGVAPGEGLEPHLALALAASMGMLFSHLWVLFFLLATGRGLRRAAARRPAGGGDAALAGLDRLRGGRRLAFAALGAALAAIAALIATGGATFTRAGASGLHGALFFAALALQLAALAAEWRALAAHAALFAALDFAALDR